MGPAWSARALAAPQGHDLDSAKGEWRPSRQNFVDAVLGASSDRDSLKDLARRMAHVETCMVDLIRRLDR